MKTYNKLKDLNYDIFEDEDKWIEVSKKLHVDKIFSSKKTNYTYEIDDLNGYHVETIYLNSEDMLKRILRVTSDHKREYGITLDNNEKLKDGDILYNEDKKLIVVKANSEDVLIIKPSSITEMGVIAHALGNRHLQAQFEDNKMIKDS